MDGNRCPKTLVLCFDHVKQANEVGDPQTKGNQHAQIYYNILTPLKKEDTTMYRFDLTGYAYGIGKPIDITWVGYNYTNVEKPIHDSCINRNENLYKLNIRHYYKKDGTLVLNFGPIDRYCNGYELYYQGHYKNFMNGLKKEKYQVVVTHSEHELQ